MSKTETNKIQRATDRDVWEHGKIKITQDLRDERDERAVSLNKGDFKIK